MAIGGGGMDKGNGKEAGLVGQIVNPQNLALLRKSDRFVVMAAGLIVVAALGAIAALPDEPVLALVLALASMLIVAGLVALVQWRALSLGDLEADLQLQAASAQAVNGDWWQIVPAKDHSGLSYLSIAIADVADRHAMHGIAFDEHGHRTARFSSDVVAVRTSTPVEIYYLYRGIVFDHDKKVDDAQNDAVRSQTAGPDPEKLDGGQIISGLGRFRFDSVGREQRPMQGEGAFTRGTPNELKFGTVRLVELLRFTVEESQHLAEDPSSLGELAKAKFDDLGLEPGREMGDG